MTTRETKKVWNNMNLHLTRSEELNVEAHQCTVTKCPRIATLQNCSSSNDFHFEFLRPDNFPTIRFMNTEVPAQKAQSLSTAGVSIGVGD